MTSEAAVNAGFFNFAEHGVRSTTFDNLVAPPGGFAEYNESDINQIQGLGPSASADGVAFYTGTTFPATYQGDAFIARYNSTVSDSTGHSITYNDLVTVDPTTGNVRIIANNFDNPLAVLYDGSGNMIIADYGDSAIYRLSSTPTPTPTPPDTNADSDTNSDPDADADTNSDTDADADSDTDADADSDTDTHAVPDTDADPDTNADPDTDSDANAYPDADSAAGDDHRRTADIPAQAQQERQTGWKARPDGIYARFQHSAQRVRSSEPGQFRDRNADNQKGQEDGRAHPASDSELHCFVLAHRPLCNPEARRQADIPNGWRDHGLARSDERLGGNARGYHGFQHRQGREKDRLKRVKALIGRYRPIRAEPTLP